MVSWPTEEAEDRPPARPPAQMHELASLLDGLGAVEVDEAHAFDGAPPR